MVVRPYSSSLLEPKWMFALVIGATLFSTVKEQGGRGARGVILYIFVNKKIL
jgi:hypothetical protein